MSKRSEGEGMSIVVPPNPRRVVLAAIPLALLVDVLEHRIRAANIPKDARVVGVETSLAHGGILVCFQHESFDEVPSGNAAPCMVLEFAYVSTGSRAQA